MSCSTRAFSVQKPNKWTIFCKTGTQNHFNSSLPILKSIWRGHGRSTLLKKNVGIDIDHFDKRNYSAGTDVLLKKHLIYLATTSMSCL